MSEIKNISLSYGGFANDYVNSQLKFITTIKRHIMNNETIPDFNELTEENLITVLNKLISLTNDIYDINQFNRLCEDIITMADTMKSKSLYDESFYESLNKLNDELYKLFITKLYSNLYIKEDSGLFALGKLHMVYEALSTAMNYCRNICEPARVVKIIAIKNPSINESSIMNTTSYKIYSAHSPNGTNIVGKHITRLNPDCIINSLIDPNIRCDELLGKLPILCEYFNSIKSKLNNDNVELFKSAINNSYNKLISNNTGLNLLNENLKSIYETISNIECVDYESYKPINEMKCYIESMMNTVTSRISQNTLSDNINESYDILGEMGLSFVYNFSEDLSGDGEIDAFNEACEKYVSEDLYDDIIQCMTEGLTDYLVDPFKRAADRHENIKDYNMNAKLDRKSREEQRKNDKKDREEVRKAERKDRKMQAKIERDTRRAEQREEKRQQRSEQRKRNIDTFIYKNKVIAMTDPNARKMMRLFKSCVAALVGAGTGAALFGKQSALLTAALGFLAKYSSLNTSSSLQRSEIANYIQSEIKVMESKIDDLERAGDIKNKAKLMRLKSKMETTYRAMVHCLPSGELTYLT